MRARTMALVLFTIGCTKPAAGPSEPGGGGGPGLTAPAAPAELAIPAGNALTWVATAKGVQIYECAAEGGGAPAWKLRAPRAELFASGSAAGSHYGGIDKGLPPGPYWEASDGSRVHGARPVSVPHEGSIPLLRLEAADTSGTGALAKVAFIQRLDTEGGVAPAGACEPGKQTEVPYSATYYFYSKP